MTGTYVGIRNPWIAFAADTEGIHCYYFTATTTAKEKAEAHFCKIAHEQGWEPFTDLEVHRITEHPQNDVLRKVGWFPFPKERQ